ncbi:MAG: DUF3833 family protein [Hyphomonadaceae bacterium]|nr:DUF3833 family protein [Hyphomonadaceae bacterium]
MKASVLGFAGASALLLTACATAPAAPESALPQPFVLERDLGGHNTARGEFRAITGTRRPFTAQLEGVQEGDVFVLTEHFAFDDGERDTKTWRLRQVAPGQYEGTREDVVGVAIGRQDGNAFRLEYDVRLSAENDRGRVVRFRDVLFLNEQGIGNTASVGWLGFRVGSVTIQMQRTNSQPPSPDHQGS